MQKIYRKSAAEFREYWKTIPRANKKEMRNIIMSACKIEYPTFINWLNDVCKIHPLAKEKIEEVTGVKIFSE